MVHRPRGSGSGRGWRSFLIGWGNMAGLGPRGTPALALMLRAGQEGKTVQFLWGKVNFPISLPFSLYPFLSAWDSSLGQLDSKVGCQPPAPISGPTFPPGWEQGPPTLPTYDCGAGKIFLRARHYMVVGKSGPLPCPLSVLCPAICLCPMGTVLCFWASEESTFPSSQGNPVILTPEMPTVAAQMVFPGLFHVWVTR